VSYAELHARLAPVKAGECLASVIDKQFLIVCAGEQTQKGAGANIFGQVLRIPPGTSREERESTS